MKNVNITVNDLEVLELALSKFLPKSTEVKNQVNETTRKIKVLLNQVDKYTAEGNQVVVPTCIKDNLSVDIIGVTIHCNIFRTAYTQKEAHQINAELNEMGCNYIIQSVDDIAKLPEE